jgi:hypothetical protein
MGVGLAMISTLSIAAVMHMNANTTAAQEAVPSKVIVLDDESSHAGGDHDR